MLISVGCLVGAGPAQQPGRVHRVGQEKAAARSSASAAAIAPPVRLTILGDNSVARPGVCAVWGFACLVEARGHTVLFDTGADAAVLKNNLAALKIAPARIEAVVISHYHGDHTLGAPGLGRLPGVRVFTPRKPEAHPSEVAALESADLTLVPVTRATTLFEGIVVSEPCQFGTGLAIGKPNEGDAPAEWEQALTVDTPEGLVVVVGCSHPGILPMLERIKRQTGRPLHLVIGGFHLLEQPDAELLQLATAIKALGAAHVSATHCSGESAAHVFREIFGNDYVSAGVGAVIKLPFSGRAAAPHNEQSNAFNWP